MTEKSDERKLKMDSMIMKSNYRYKPSLIKKHSGKATHGLTNHWKAKNMSEKAVLLVSYYFEFE